VGERLELFWYRFKYPILVLLLLLPAGAGTFLGAQSAKTPPTIERERGEIVELAANDGSFEACFASHEIYGPDRIECVEKAAAAAPLFKSGDGLLLPGPVWANGAERTPLAGVTGTIVAATATDLDNDGFEELLLSVEGRGLRIYSKNRNGQLEDTTTVRMKAASPATAAPGTAPATTANPEAETRTPGDEVPRDILSIDLDSDGFMDVVTADANGARAYLNLGWAGPGILLRAQDGDHSAVLTTAVRDLLPRQGRIESISAIRGGDLDGDGAADLLLTSPRGLLLILWGGEASFEPEPALLPVPAGTMDLEIGDVNRDGRNDLVLGVNIRSLPTGVSGACPYNRPCDRGRGVTIGGTVVLVGGPGRTFQEDPRLTIDGVEDLSAIELIDANMDGWQEIAIGVEPLTEDVAATRENGVLLYDPIAPSGTIEGYEPWIGAAVNVTGAVRAISAMDIDEDGDEDLLMSGRGREGLRYWQNDLPQKRWLRVSVVGRGGLDTPGTVRNGTGAVVEITYQGRTWRREIGMNSGRGEAQQYVAVIGLGDGAAIAEKVTVYFPASRTRAELVDVELDRTLEVAEPVG
jgi:hypothetical protein